VFTTKLKPKGSRAATIARLEFFGNGERVVALGKESVEIKKNGVTVPGSEYATVLDFHDGLVTRFLVIQDPTAVVDAYKEQLMS
jgi:hypothetical protein